MYKHPVPVKVPAGDISCGNKKEKQGYIQDISQLNKSELLDLKNRQELLLRNKNRISKLPDKGLKIEHFYKQILQQLKVHENVDRAAEMFSELNIASVGKESLTRMEWSGTYNAHHHTDVDSDDEIDDQDTDPLKILAQSTNVGKIIIAAKSEDTLITVQDLEDIYKFKRDQDECSTAANLFEIGLRKSASKFSFLRRKQQSVGNNVPSGSHITDGHSTQLNNNHLNTTLKEKFLPFRTTTSNVHDPEKERQRFKEHPIKWENTSATPPPLTHSPAKVLSLKESVQLQEEKNKQLQQTQEQYAEERLLQRQEIQKKVMSTVYSDVMQGSTGLTSYRDVSDSEEEMHEYKDDDEYDSEQNS